MPLRPIHPVLLFLSFARFASAGEGVPAVPASSQDPAPERPPGWLAVGPGYIHQFETDLDGMDGSFSVDRWRLDLGTRIPVSEALTLTVGAETEWSRYDFEGDGPSALGLAVDAEDLFYAQFGVLGQQTLNDSWQLMAGGTISWGGDGDAGWSDAVGGSGLLGVTYRFTPRFSLSPGVLAMSRLEDDALVIPVLGLDWQINDAWRLRSIGPGVELTLEANEQWGFFLRGLYRPRDFRLDSNAAVSSGVLRERAFPVTIGAEWRPDARITATVFGGAILGGQLRLLEDDGQEVFEEDYDDITPLVGGSLRLRF